MNTTSNSKIEAFNYFKEKVGKLGADTGSKIVLMKLLFFTAAVDATETNDGLLDIFDDFYALPLGHVESEVYSNIRYGTPPANAKQFPHYHTRIDAALDSLTVKNSAIFKLSAAELVDISHKWYSWRVLYADAVKQGKRSAKIPTNIIKREAKHFS